MHSARNALEIFLLKTVLDPVVKQFWEIFTGYSTKATYGFSCCCSTVHCTFPKAVK